MCNRGVAASPHEFLKITYITCAGISKYVIILNLMFEGLQLHPMDNFNFEPLLRFYIL